MTKKKIFHKLRENKGSKLYNRFVFFDTETHYTEVNEEQHHFLKLGVACERVLGTGKERQITFTQIKNFWDFVLDTNEYTTVVVAHNMHFDLNVVKGLKFLPALGFEIVLPVFESGTFILVAINRQRRKRLIFLDTFNYFKTSIETIGEILKLPKLDIDFEQCSFTELETYCKRDVEITKEIMLQWIDFLFEHDLGNLQYTIASQAFTAYRHKYMHYEILIHANQTAIELEQQSYRGGRTEAFYIGELNDVVIVDVNSLYPFVMKHCVFPNKLIGVKENLTYKDLIYLMNQGYLLVADCDITTYETAIGVKHEIGKSKKLIFPIGNFKAVITNPEIIFLLATNGKINKVRQVAIYEGACIFRHYVTELYNLRKQYQSKENFTFQQMVKYILNSLYGKFGQQQRLLRKIGEAPKDLVMYEHCIDAQTGKRYTQIIFGGFVWVNEITKEESFNSFTAIASYVTAYARIYLHLLMLLPLTVYYCDTDSLMIPRTDLIKFGYLLGNELGQLKLEYSGDYVFIHGAKDYQVDEVIKRKGIKKDAVEIQPNVFQQLQFLKTKSLIKEQFIDRVIVRTIEKHCKRKYDKGVISFSGKVEPIVLYE